MPSRIAIAAKVVAAFFDSGGLNAGTPLAIASVPVSATEPDGEGLEQQEDADVSGPTGRHPARPDLERRRRRRSVDEPDRRRSTGRADEQVGRDREDVARLAQPAQVGRS